MNRCDPKDVALKALFLGPQSENGAWLEAEWAKVLRHWLAWRRSRFPEDGPAISSDDMNCPEFRERQNESAQNLDELLRMLEAESPKFTPRFLGHMTSEISLPAVLGHLAVLLHNPNQTSREVSVMTSEIERQAITDLHGLVGFDPVSGRGHFTSGGTVANLEGVWRFLYRWDRTHALTLLLTKQGRPVARPHTWDAYDAERKKNGVAEADLASFSLLELGGVEFARRYQEIMGTPYRSPLILAPASRHFSWPKAATLLGLGKESLRPVVVDENGRMSMESFAEIFAAARKKGRTIGMVVTVSGSTELGAVDPIDEVSDFLLKHRKETGEDVWHHVDAAYGGYFCSLLSKDTPRLRPKTRLALHAIRNAHSLTLDPHKLGFVPYACGAFLAKDEAHYRSFPFGAPYLLADNNGSWMHTIEGSRAGTGAAATWMSNRTIGLDADGYGRLLERNLVSTEFLTQSLGALGEELSVVGDQDLNIVCVAVAREGETLKQVNARTLRCFQHFRESPLFSVSKTSFSLDCYERLIRHALGPKRIVIDDTQLYCLRLVLMNPFLVTKESKVDFIGDFIRELKVGLAAGDACCS